MTQVRACVANLVRVIDSPSHPVCQVEVIAGFRQQPGHSILDDLCKGADPAGDDRGARGVCLHDDDRESLETDRWRHHGDGTPHLVEHGGGGDRTEVLGMSASGCLFHEWRHGSAAGDTHDSRVQGGRTEKSRDALLLRESSHVQDTGTRAGTRTRIRLEKVRDDLDPRRRQAPFHHHLALERGQRDVRADLAEGAQRPMDADGGGGDSRLRTRATNAAVSDGRPGK